MATITSESFSNLLEPGLKDIFKKHYNEFEDIEIDASDLPSDLPNTPKSNEPLTLSQVVEIEVKRLQEV